MQYREYQSDDLSQAQPASELARPLSRLAAVIIDILIGIIVTAPFWIIALVPSDDGEVSTGLIAASIVVGIIFFIIQMVLLGTRGQTIGKIAMKVRIVDVQTGEHPGWPRLVLLRAIVNGLLTPIPLLGFIYFLVDSLFIFRPDHRTVHDLYSGTRVDKL